MLAGMTDALEPEDAEDHKLREKLAGRVGRQVEGVASVRPATRDGWVSWVGFGADESFQAFLTAAAAVTATATAQDRRRARATGLETRMALAVTGHDAHLFRTRAMGRVIGDHVMAVPYGMVTQVAVGKKESLSVLVSLVKVTIELADGSKIKLRGDAKHRRVFEQLQAGAAAVPLGTVPPPPEQRPDPTVARVLASAAGHLAKGAVSVGGHVRAGRTASK